MQKLKLDLDALEVASFEAEPRQVEARGTVDAHIVPVLIAATIVLNGARWGYRIGTML